MKVYTHSGRFHADEVLACAILSMAIPSLQIIRLKVIEAFPTDGFLLDIGREYNPSCGLYDHHQEFLTDEDGYPLATAGLVWRNYGENICGSRAIAEVVRDNFIRGIDASDSDNFFSVSASCVGGSVKVKTFSQIIAGINPENINDNDTEFYQAVFLAKSVLKNEIRYAKAMVRVSEQIAKARVGITETGIKYLVFDEHPGPWQAEVCKTETEYVIVPSSHPGSPVSVIAVPIHPETRDLRNPIDRPEWFKGFIHNGKWIAGCQNIIEAERLVAAQ